MYERRLLNNKFKLENFPECNRLRLKLDEIMSYEEKRKVKEEIKELKERASRIAEREWIRKINEFSQRDYSEIQKERSAELRYYLEKIIDDFENSNFASEEEYIMESERAERCRALLDRMSF